MPLKLKVAVTVFAITPNINLTQLTTLVPFELIDVVKRKA
jgi:hypothetical protein